MQAAEAAAPETVDTTEIEEEDGMVLDAVEGFPNWRRVDRENETPYYFHVLTQETRWEIPTTN